MFKYSGTKLIFMDLNVAERQQSEFNMAVSYLNRLNFLFYACNEAAMNLKSGEWFHALLAVFRELSTSMKDTEITEWNKKITEINNMIGADMRKKNQQQGMIQPELYNELHMFEMFLRGVLNKSGLQTKMADEASKALR